MRIRIMIIDPHLRETNPYAPLATVVNDRQLMADESTARTYSVLWVWPAAWLTTAVAGGVFGFSVCAIGGSIPLAFVGFVFGLMIAGTVAFPVSSILYAIIAVVTRRLTSDAAILSTGICGGISGVISTQGMSGGAPWGWVVGAGFVGAVVPALLVKNFFR